jgi:signal transduction histidine kinase
MTTETIKVEADEAAELHRRSGPIIEPEPIPTVEVRGSEHIVTSVNDAFCTLLGKAKAELMEKPFAEIVPGGSECVPILDQVYETGDAKAYAHADSFDPSHAYWLYAMWPDLDAAKCPVGVIIQLTKARKLHQDTAALNELLLVAGLHQHELRETAEKLSTQLQAEIAERRKTEVALTETLQELQRAHWATERASLAKDHFLAALSHELRTPLTPVLLTAAALATDLSLPLDVREQLAMMRRNIELEAQLIDDLLDITRIAHGKFRLAPAVADLHALIRQTEEIIGTEFAARGVRVIFVFEAARHHALADVTRMEQVFWNLIRNAVKFTPEGGTVTVRTYNDDMGRILVEVEDTGIGISAETLPVIFNAFEQGKVAGRRYGGLGLGLSISHAIVTAHQGTIRAESDGEGYGAKFTITLATVDAPPPPQQASLLQHDPPRALRLLIVEDHDSTREVLGRLLARAGHRIVTTATMADALKAFRADTFDAVISDLGLPDGSGLELMRELHRIRPVPGIALSGYGMEEDLRRTSEAGFLAHLVKPVNLEELRLALEKIQVTT